MEEQLEKVREQQKASWNKFSAGWKKWDVEVMDFMQPVGDEIIDLIHPSQGDIVLDVASGTGEPGLTIASMLDRGKVVSTDLAEDMLQIAAEKADQKGLHNFETKACDVSELPFDDNTFDAISCRFGFMFFPDMLIAAKEMYRVLKPGGRFATSVWNIPEKNFWITAIMSVINKKMELPAPPPGAPGMFRCAPEGLMAGILQQAGFNNVREMEIDTTLQAGTNETYWRFHNEVGAPIVAALSKASDIMKATIKSAVFENLDTKFAGKAVNPPASALVIYGEK